jgi:YidC/Oxa1 family membrane protein insertase
MVFETLIVKPIFNLLVLIYAIIPGHNFGLAIILFTIVVRLLLWPLVKKQLHQAKLMRKIQPELKRIAKETKGDKQRQALMQMELYKEKGINPFRSIGVVLLQLPILIGLYAGLRRVIKDPHEIINFAYPALQHLPWMEQLAKDIKQFDSSLFGVVDLHNPAIGPNGLYIPALLIVLGSVVVQYYQARQLMPQDKDSRGLKSILKEAGSGKQADQQEVNAAVSRVTIFFLPAMIFFFTVSLPSALSLYWLVGGIVAVIQQSIVLREDEEEMEALAGAPTKDVASIPEAELVQSDEIENNGGAPTQIPKSTKKKSAKKRGNKRRRK